MAGAVSIPNETAWAEGTRWTYHDNSLGLPDTWVYVPESTSPRTPGQYGLVFHLTGCGQRTFQVAQAGGWPDAAEAYGLVVVVPGTVQVVHPNRDAPNVECLNYGYDGAYGAYIPSRNDADQSAIIGAAQTLGGDAELAIDPNQVYVAGLSAGGAVAVEVACMAPDVFAGVATAAAPGIGSSQGTAVMPPAAGHSAASVSRLCEQWAAGSGAPEMLGEQVVAIVSDNNSLPPGIGAFDISLFNDQTVWDGDKFCPHSYQTTRAAGFASIMGLSAQPSVCTDFSRTRHRSPSGQVILRVRQRASSARRRPSSRSMSAAAAELGGKSMRSRASMARSSSPFWRQTRAMRRNAPAESGFIFSA